MAASVYPTLKIDQQRYHIQSTKVILPRSLIEILNTVFEELFILATAVTWEKSTFDDVDLQKICRSYENDDDVWCPSFRSLIVLLRCSKDECDIETKNTICVDNFKRILPRGPLVIERTSGRVFRVAKLFPDTNAAFVSGILPSAKTQDVFHELSAKNTIEIAVPSRLYYERTNEKPFAGLRIGVKDTIALKGLRTGFGSKAWRKTYKAEKYTAPCIQRLVDAGAVIVGKLVSSELAEGVDVGQWTQGVCPFNPRGDGQQQPSSSSTGSAVAAAAYAWLDIAIGTDTGGSIRHPAGVNGLFGQRPTTGSVSLEGVLGATDLFNTVGIFARSVELFTNVGSYLLDEAKSSQVSPGKKKYNLLYPTRYAPSKRALPGRQQRWFPHPEDRSDMTEAEIHMEAIVRRVEEELGCERTAFNIYDVWAATPPKGQPRSLDEATGRIYGDITTSSACATGVDQFIADYAAANGGNQPPISDIVKQRLDYGRNLPNDDIAAALEATEAFRRWMEVTLFGSYDADTTTIMLLPQSLGQPQYRDQKPQENSSLFFEAFSLYAFGFLCGCPDYTVPIGEASYQSRITDRTEYLPVSLSFLSRPGTDLDLFNVISQLHEKGIISDVMPGSRMYPTQSEVAYATGAFS